jgi:hypothetical protein
MLDDFAGAYEALDLTLRLEPPRGGLLWEPNTPLLQLSSVNANSSHNIRPGTVMDTLTDPHAVGKSSGFGSVIVTLTVNSLEAYDWITRIRGTSPTQAITAAIPKIQVIPVLFNLGVNEMQSVANVAGTKAVDVQTEINRKGANQLRAYYEACIKASVKLGSASSEERLPSLLTTLEEHVETEARQRGKLVELLLVSCYVARLLNGARTTSCKSAKDRTSMFHSLEVVRLAEQWGWIDRSVRLNIFLNCRSCSCRVTLFMCVISDRVTYGCSHVRCTDQTNRPYWMSCVGLLVCDSRTAS